MSPSRTEAASLWNYRESPGEKTVVREKRMMPQQIRILLVDDHTLFRESLSRLLEAEPEFRIAGTCATVGEALEGLDAADVVLLDYDLGEEQGTTFLEEAKRRGFAGRILMVTAGMSDAGTLRVFQY